MERESRDKVSIWLIVAASVVVPVLVAFLFFIPDKLNLGEFVYLLPHFHAGVNSLTSLVLVAALVSIKAGHPNLHRALMMSAMVMGVLFLISYVLYHSSVDSVVYGDVDGNGELDLMEKELATSRNSYLLVLLSHIVLSIVALPLVLLSFYQAIKGNFEKHKKLVKFAYPIWLYVSISGVLVYFMISPYY